MVDFMIKDDRRYYKNGDFEVMPYYIGTRYQYHIIIYTNKAGGHEKMQTGTFEELVAIVG